MGSSQFEPTGGRFSEKGTCRLSFTFSRESWNKVEGLQEYHQCDTPADLVQLALLRYYDSLMAQGIDFTLYENKEIILTPPPISPDGNTADIPIEKMERQWEFPAEMLHALDSMVIATGVDTRADVIRDALTYLAEND